MVDTWKLTHIDVCFAASCCAYIVTKIRVQCKIGWQRAQCGLPVLSSVSP